MTRKKWCRYPSIKNIKHAIKNRSGSEALEMVYSTFALMLLILSTMMIIGYAIQVNQVSYAGKRVARYVEVAGQADQTDLDTLLKELLPNQSKLGATVTVTTDNWENVASRKIQLRENFTVHISASYPLMLANPGYGSSYTIKLPINVNVNGQSEVYWK